MIKFGLFKFKYAFDTDHTYGWTFAYMSHNKFGLCISLYCGLF